MSNKALGEHQKFMTLAIAQGEKALANGQFPAGCVLVASDCVVANGCRENSGAGDNQINEVDHAEIIALRKLIQKLEVDPGHVTLYSTMEPCLMCFSTLLLNGVRNVVFAYEDVMGGGTDLVLASLKPLYSAMEVNIVPGILRDEGLSLFYDFFSSEHNLYWKGSLLASYTLEQGKKSMGCK